MKEIFIILLVLFAISIIDTRRCSIGPALNAADLPINHYEPFTAVINKKFYVFSGFTHPGETTQTHIYDIETNSWSRGYDTPTAISHCQSDIWRNGTRYLFAVGGFLGMPTNVAWRYDALLDVFDRMPNLPVKTASAAVMIDNRNHLHVIGGLVNRDDDTDNHWILDLSDLSAGWKSGPPLPRKRNHFQGRCIENKLYVIGGQFRHDTDPLDVPLVDIFNIDTQTWSVGANLPQERSHAEPGTFIAKDEIVVAGGRRIHHTPVDTILKYSPLTDSWEQLGTLPERRIGAAANFLEDVSFNGVRGDYIIVSGGGWEYNVPKPNTWLFKYECTD